MGIVTSTTMLAIVLAGAAVVREREHGTMDHLLVMPLTPFEIAMSKIWANGFAILVAVALSLYFVVRGLLHIPVAGSIPFFLVGVALYLLVYLPLSMLSGANIPLESMPPWLAAAVQISPTVHFVSFAQAILYRGAGFGVVWPEFAIVALGGGVFLALSLWRFRAVTSAAM